MFSICVCQVVARFFYHHNNRLNYNTQISFNQNRGNIFCQKYPNSVFTAVFGENRVALIKNADWFMTISTIMLLRVPIAAKCCFNIIINTLVPKTKGKECSSSFSQFFTNGCQVGHLLWWRHSSSVWLSPFLRRVHSARFASRGSSNAHGTTFFHVNTMFSST